jgi:hypothetical protein
LKILKVMIMVVVAISVQAGPIVAAVAQGVPVHSKIAELGEIWAGRERDCTFE